MRGSCATCAPVAPAWFACTIDPFRAHEDELEGVLAILCAVGGPMAYLILREYWRSQDRRLELQQRGAPKVAALEEEKKQLEARIQNLESIVCSVDFELNQRLSRLAA